MYEISFYVTRLRARAENSPGRILSCVRVDGKYHLSYFGTGPEADRTPNNHRIKYPTVD